MSFPRRLIMNVLPASRCPLPPRGVDYFGGGAHSEESLMIFSVTRICNSSPSPLSVRMRLTIRNLFSHFLVMSSFIVTSGVYCYYPRLKASCYLFKRKCCEEILCSKSNFIAFQMFTICGLEAPILFQKKTQKQYW